MSPEGAVTKETLGWVISYLYLYNMEKENISSPNLSYIQQYIWQRDKNNEHNVCNCEKWIEIMSFMLWLNTSNSLPHNPEAHLDNFDSLVIESS